MKSAPKLSVFLADPSANKSVSGIIDAWFSAVLPEDSEHPEESTNTRVVILHKIFDILSELHPDQAQGDDVHSEDEDEEEEDTEEDDEETASVKAVAVELAKKGGNSHMSAFYKRVMGGSDPNLRTLVEPWHNDATKFIKLWADLGNRLYSESPADEPSETYTLSASKDGTETETAAAIPSSLYQGLRRMGFTQTANSQGMTLWELLGDPLVPGYRLSVMRNTIDVASPYILTLFAGVSSLKDRGSVLKQRTLTYETSATKITEEIVKLIDRASAHSVGG